MIKTVPKTTNVEPKEKQNGAKREPREAKEPTKQHLRNRVEKVGKLEESASTFGTVLSSQIDKKSTQTFIKTTITLKYGI